MKIKIVMDSSGPGSIPRGTVLEVGKDISEADAQNLLEVRTGHSGAFAVPVVEERVESPVPKQERVETREDKAAEVHAEPAVHAEPVVQDSQEEFPVKRGPGRPPGSRNRPKPQ